MAPCPSAGLTLGHAKTFKDPTSTNNTGYSVSADVNMVSCFQRMEKLTAQVQLEMPDFVISSTNPPRVVANTSHFIDGGPGSFWQYSLQQFLLGLGSTASSSSLEDARVDRFTEALAHGKASAVPSSQWRKNSSGSIATPLDAANYLYATYMV